MKIRENITKKFKYIPSKLIIEKHIYPTYKCEECSKQNEKALIFNARNVLAFPKCMADSSLVVHVITEKIMKYVPLYRQEKFFSIKGLDISRKNMSNWLMMATNYLRPLFELMHKDILNNDIVLIDETTINVITNIRSQCYIWMINSSKYDIPILLYFFKESREYKNALEILDGFKGHYVQSDCYQAYNDIPNVIDCCCLAHARRKFTDILKITKNDDRFKFTISVVDTAVKYINQLYKIENELTKSKATIEQIYKTHQEKSIPILAEYKEWLEKQCEIFPPKSKIAEALNYSLYNFENLSNYCLDGRLDIDNNRSERQAKSYVMMRKNSLFCFSYVGADASAILLSFVETAKFNNLNVEKYLEYVFNELALLNNHGEDELRNLLPYSSTLPNNLKIQK